MLPLALVSVSYREAASAMRAALVAFDDGVTSPARHLLRADDIAGYVRIESCARVEWLLSGARAAWSAQLLAAALVGAVGADPGLRPRVRSGGAALAALLRVAAGLDSIAQGEQAIGRQVLQAFSVAHGAGTTDPVTRVIWAGVRDLLVELRRMLPRRMAWGVQTLVVRWLRESGVASDAGIAIFGSGAIGRATQRALRDTGFRRVDVFNRAGRDMFFLRAEAADAVVVCSGAPRAWLELPARVATAATVIDVGCPAQVRSAPGWRCVDLDTLLAGQGSLLPDEVLSKVEAACEAAAARIARRLQAPSRGETLAAMAALRRCLLRETLPDLLGGLPQAQSRRVLLAVNAVLHEFLCVVREGRA